MNLKTKQQYHCELQVASCELQVAIFRCGPSVCLTVGPSVHRSVPCYVVQSNQNIALKKASSYAYCPCTTVAAYVIMYPAMLFLLPHTYTLL